MRHASDATDNHHFRLNITTDKSTSLNLRKMGLQFKTLSSIFFCKTAFYIFFVIKREPFEVKRSMRLFRNNRKLLDKTVASISQETKTARKISSRNSTLGETKLIFLVYRKDSEKSRVNRSAC